MSDTFAGTIPSPPAPPGAPPGAPPSAPAPGALPVALSTFIGREREAAELGRLLAESRLLTLTGAGGSGKSRLAREVVARSAPDLGVEAVWVELAALEEAGGLARQVADACGLHEEVRTGDASALAGFLHHRPLLLVLDNCEHLVEACALLADGLLRSCPRLRIVATSREALGVAGERAWLVPALTLPAADTRSAAAALATDSVRLFRDRAREVVASWELTDADAPAVVEICRRLDGIPLAIELAAARVRVLTPADIRDRLDDAFRLLAGGGRTALPRHRTLRATMEWSHDLLSEPVRTLLRRLAVFRGGFSLDAVEAVGSGAGIDPLDALDLLARLVDRSLVEARDAGGRVRYGLLETVRQYAAERLAEAGEEAAVRERHARWAAGFVARAEPGLVTRERPARVEELTLEAENVREALAWSRNQAPALHVEMVGRLWWYWFSSQHWREAARWIGEAMELPEARAAGLPRAKLLFAAGALAGLRVEGAGAARALLREAEALAAVEGEGRLEAYALNYQGLTLAGEGDPSAVEPLNRAVAWFEAHDDLFGLRLSKLLLGATAMAAGDPEASERHNLEGVEVARRFGLDRELSVALQNLATVYLSTGDIDRAEAAVTEGLAAGRRDPSWYHLANGLHYAAEVAGARGQPLLAARLVGASRSAREVVGARPFEADRVRLEAALPGWREAAGAWAFDRALREGAELAPLRAAEFFRGQEEEESAGGAGEAGVKAPTPAAATTAARAEHEPAEPDRSGSVSELAVRALGSFEVTVAGQPVPADAWPYVKPREFLVHLLVHPRGRSRDQIGAALWPDATPSQAANSFHVTVHHLRKALGRPEWIEREGDRYRLAPTVRRWFDADAFEEAARDGLRGSAGHEAVRDGMRDPVRESPEGRVRALEAALALYGGELLEGDATAPWLEDTRDRLRALRVDATLALGRALEQGGDPERAAGLYEGLLPSEELNEELHRRLMACWAGAGQRSRALRLYARLETLLREELDAEPEPETAELAQSLRGG